ncbi:MAG: DUF72 domain-containing protein [Fidelibacterota bacterium]
MDIHIGTSGFSYKGWVGIFYPPSVHPGKWLEFYSRHFSTVEMNSTFYHLPKPVTMENWRLRVPENFVFSLKASRFLTHQKKLSDPEEPLQNFLDLAVLMKEKLGCIIYQLPPGLKSDTGLLEHFLSILPKNLEHTIEFRNNDWHRKEVKSMLEKYNVSFCINDFRGIDCPEWVTSDVVYIRRHGPGGYYQGSYTDEMLKDLSFSIEKYLKEGKKVYTYFNNDIGGCAIENARTLRKFLLG